MSTMKKKYYHFEDDLHNYPDAWCYVVYSPRGPGKTYSSLKYSYENHIPIVYMKRTQEDVKFICRKPEKGYDSSPYVPINRDCGYNIHGNVIDNGVGGFWDDNEEDGLPIAYCFSLNVAKKIKGFDTSRCDWMVLDEFIPLPGERVNRKEGEQLLECYRTIGRDREKRGRGPLKLVLFANAEEISTPITSTLEIIDNMADLNASGESHLYLEDRGILLHHITPKEIPIEEVEKQGIYKAMQGTSWFDRSFGGEFTNNDFSNVKPQSLKGYRGYIHIKYKTHNYYIYMNDAGYYYMCKSPTKCPFSYDLNRENEQKLFYMNHQIDLWHDCAEERVKFQSYTMYDLVINFTKLFNVRR